MATKTNEMTVKQIDAELAKARKAWNDTYRTIESLEDRRRELVVLPEMRRRVGNCYVYDNSDGTEQWPMYTKIVAVQDDAYVLLHVSRMPSGRILMETTTDPGHRTRAGFDERLPLDGPGRVDAADVADHRRFQAAGLAGRLTPPPDTARCGGQG